jgi:hypothetical protein
MGGALARKRHKAQRVQPPIAMKIPGLAMCGGMLLYWGVKGDLTFILGVSVAASNGG